MTTGSHAAAPGEEVVEIRHNAELYALVAVAAAAGAGAYGWRAATGGGWVAWMVALALASIAVGHAAGWWDARTPRLVADARGVRLRSGRSWSGTPWHEVDAVDVDRTSGLLREGRLRMRSGARETVVRYGSSAGTGTDGLTQALGALGAPTRPAATMPDTVPPPANLARPPSVSGEPERPEGDPSPVAPGRRAIRADVRRDGPATVGMLALRPEPAPLPEAKELRGTFGRVGLVLETVAAPAESSQIPDTAIDAAPVDPYPTRPAEQPVIGPQLAGARARLRLSVDGLAERTRIRPHVIESIEVDDFVPCGGDFYARGHIRALARMLGVDPTPLVTTYDERYASAPIDARRVFAAELASGPAPSLRRTQGGPNWAALLGMVTVLAILWGVARVLMPVDADVRTPLPATGAGVSPAPTLPDPDRFAGLGAPVHRTRLTALRLTAQGGSSVVAVRDDAGEVVWRGRLDDGEAQTVRISGSATVVAGDGGVVVATVNGHPRGPLGDSGVPVQRVIGGSGRG